jgi:hypothetical protein
MTQTEFNNLPGLLTLSVFREVTGLSKENVGQLVKSKELKVWMARQDGRRRFYKSDAARIAGFKL